MIKKVTSVEKLISTLDDYRKQGKKIVFTNGCFDLLHVGHVRYLQEAKTLGDVLIVGINSDESFRTLNKGAGRPIVPEHQRQELIAALACVDFVIHFDEMTPLNLIRTVAPDVLVKGGDWSLDGIVGRQEVEEKGGTVVAIPLVPNISTSLLVQHIQNEVLLPSTIKRTQDSASPPESAGTPNPSPTQVSS